MEFKKDPHSYVNQSGMIKLLTSWGNSPPEVSSFSREKKHVKKKPNYCEYSVDTCFERLKSPQILTRHDSQQKEDQIKSPQVPNKHENHQKFLNTICPDLADCQQISKHEARMLNSDKHLLVHAPDSSELIANKSGINGQQTDSSEFEANKSDENQTPSFQNPPNSVSCESNDVLSSDIIALLREEMAAEYQKARAELYSEFEQLLVAQKKEIDEKRAANSERLLDGLSAVKNGLSAVTDGVANLSSTFIDQLCECEAAIAV